MAITVKKTPAWTPGQGFSLTGTGPGMVVPSPGGGGGGGGGGSRPLIDANHIHVYNFNETSGTTIIDSVGGQNLTLSGTPETNYRLNQPKSGANPWFEIMEDGANIVPASSSALNVSVTTGITLECVMYFDALPVGGESYRTIMDLRSTSGPLNAAYMSINNLGVGAERLYGGVHKSGQDTYSQVIYQPPVGQPFHAMFVYDKTELGGGLVTCKTYVNGVDWSPGGYGGGYSHSLDGMNQLSIGGYPAYSRSTKCFIRDVRISNIARDAAYGVSAGAALTT
jgi:hypothetical protein